MRAAAPSRPRNSGAGAPRSSLQSGQKTSGFPLRSLPQKPFFHFNEEIFLPNYPPRPRRDGAEKTVVIVRGRGLPFLCPANICRPRVPPNEIPHNHCANPGVTPPKAPPKSFYIIFKQWHEFTSPAAPRPRMTGTGAMRGVQGGSPTPPARVWARNAQ